MQRSRGWTRQAAQRLLGRYGYSIRRTSEFSAEDDWGLSDADRLIVRLACRYSMAGSRRMSALLASIDYCIRAGIEGDFVECGVWRGGSALAMALKLEQLGVQDRGLWLYDTFQGMTTAGPFDVESGTGVPASQLLSATAVGDGNNVWAFATIGDVLETLHLTSYPRDNMHLIVGDVTETLSQQSPETISLLRLDTDFYDSTRAELDALFDRVTPGGVVIVDDYGHWQGARRAVDEHLAGLELRPLLIPIDYSGRLVVKPR